MRTDQLERVFNDMDPDRLFQEMNRAFRNLNDSVDTEIILRDENARLISENQKLRDEIVRLKRDLGNREERRAAAAMARKSTRKLR